MSERGWWTGGQYSLVRAVFGLYLFIHFAMLLPWAKEIFETVLPRDASPLIHLFPNILAVADVAMPLIAAGALAAVFFAIGLHDRIAAVVMWYVLACLFGRNPLIANPSLPFAGWLLLAHAMLPPAPFGSWVARGRVDPRGGWTFPRPIWTAMWIVMSLGYSYSGWTKLVSPSWTDGTALARVLDNPLARPSFLRDLVLATPAPLMQLATWGALALELLYAPLALSRRIRPWIWLVMLLMHIGLVTLIDFADLSFMMVIVHLFTFDPAWVPRRAPETTDVVQYDGSCGLCHRSVRFLIAEDANGSAFTFEPLSVESESVIVQTADGRTLQQSAAVIHIAHRLGGYWRVLGIAFSLIPRVVRDAMYDGVARVRYRIFGKTKDACPLMPPDLRSRFL
ncbi:MAG TPA: DCC1-like thiol-disulfide oxidoreductase family protein [Thermoanaerobaculia bacterium]|nr:DCC1-like thiol-disulfide oxidoreductase family protein [Thermoanaerobaculia bacterium]